MNIITLSREFGSGGRELGKRLADYLDFTYVDKEILSAMARQGNMDESYVQTVLEKGMAPAVPMAFGRTFSVPYKQATTDLLLLQQRILKQIAKRGRCVIVGRSADTVLQEYAPFNLFAYADMPSKIRRCRGYENDREPVSDKEYASRIRQVDKRRRQYYELCCGKQWGQKEQYHLCLNTSGLTIKDIVPAVGEYAKNWPGKGEP